MLVRIIRHGFTAGNLKRKYIGITDEVLSKEGINALSVLRKFPDVERVYVSSLRRTSESAAILFPNARQICRAELDEMNFGVFEGRSAMEMLDDAEYRAWVDSDCLAACPGGEDKETFQNRVCAAFLDILEMEARSGSKSVNFMVHNGTIMAVLARFARPKRDYFSWSTENGGGWEAQWKDGVLRNLMVI